MFEKVRIAIACAVIAATAMATSQATAAVGSWTSSGPYGGSVFTLSVYEPGPSTLFAAGRSGVFRSLNSGTSWERIQVGLPETIFVNSLVSASNAPVLYLNSGLMVYRSGNAGELWVPVTSPVSGNHHLNRIAIRRGSSNTIAVSSSNGVYVSSNGGTSWSGPGATAGIAFDHLAFGDSGVVYAAPNYTDPDNFDGAVLIRSTDSGATWSAIETLPATFDYRVFEIAVSPVDPQRIYASNGYQVATSADAGNTWTLLDMPSTGAGCSNVSRITPHPTAANGLAVSCMYNGVHLKTDISAPSWTSWSVSQGLSVDGWRPVENVSVVLHPSFPTTPTIWTGSRDAGLFRSTNGGSSFAAINDGYRATNIRALAMHPRDTNPAGAVVLAGYGDTSSTSPAIFKSSNGAANWQTSVAGLKALQIRALTIDPTTVDADPFTAENFTVYAGGRSERYPDLTDKDGGIYKSVDAGNTWTTIDNGIGLVSGRPDMGTVRSIALDPRSCASPPATGPCLIGSGGLQTIYVAGSGRPNLSAAGAAPYSARIYKSTNAGASWTAADNGIPTSQNLGPAGEFNFAYTGGVVPLVIDPQNPQTLYAGTYLVWNPDASPDALEPTIANGIFKSVDGGASWVHSSVGLPRHRGPTSSQYDVLALAINPVNPQILYAGVVDLFSASISGRIYKSINGGASWFESSTGIAGQDVRALFIDPNDPTGETIYAGTGGDGANRGGVFRSTNGGTTWNSMSLGLPANAATSLAMPPRAPGAAARILAGTDSGVWDYTAAPDEDADGVPSSVENAVAGGDGNGDGIPDSTQSGVASLTAPASMSGVQNDSTQGSSVRVTVSFAQTTGCGQLNDVSSLPSALYPPDPAGSSTSHDPWGLINVSIPACTTTTILVKFHGANFDANWKWRNYGPRSPGDLNSFGWYSFAGARRVDAQTWELSIDARRQGNYRNDPNNILLIGGPALLPDSLFDHGFE